MVSRQATSWWAAWICTKNESLAVWLAAAVVRPRTPTLSVCVCVPHARPMCPSSLRAVCKTRGIAGPILTTPSSRWVDRPSAVRHVHVHTLPAPAYASCLQGAAPHPTMPCHTPVLVQAKEGWALAGAGRRAGACTGGRAAGAQAVCITTLPRTSLPAAYLPPCDACLALPHPPASPLPPYPCRSLTLRRTACLTPSGASSLSSARRWVCVWWGAHA